ncbi:MAG: hypothetical protein V7733_14580 [Paraglaciecola polaris]|uniref:hypothetical protein n=1 Tax=Paraglaciecola polaris TaxID=222814 RepID=UPI0030036A24
MIYCLFLVYAPVNLDKSLLRLNRFLTLGGRKAKIIIINNGEQSYKILSEDIDLIQGDNSFFEFSGWEKGKQYLEEQYTLKEDDSFCFVNDTFDKNHYFSWLTVWLYNKKLKLAAKHYSGFILGRVDSRNIEYKVDQLALSKWVSSYFFVVDYTAYQELIFINDNLRTAVEYVTDESIYFDQMVVDSAMQEHINGWLRPVGKGWYRANYSDNEVIRNKSVAILHEKFLSAALIAKNIELIHVYSGRFGRIVRKFDKRVQDYRTRNRK